MQTLDLLCQTSAIGDFFKIAGPAFVALATALSVLWTRHIAAHKEFLRRAEECERKHETTLIKQIELAEQLGVLKGKQDGITKLSAEVLAVVHENTKAKKDEGNE